MLAADPPVDRNIGRHDKDSFQPIRLRFPPWQFSVRVRERLRELPHGYQLGRRGGDRHRRRPHRHRPLLRRLLPRQTAKPPRKLRRHLLGPFRSRHRWRRNRRLFLAREAVPRLALLIPRAQRQPGPVPVHRRRRPTGAGDAVHAGAEGVASRYSLQRAGGDFHHFTRPLASRAVTCPEWMPGGRKD